jgi:hypothetical protein
MSQAMQLIVDGYVKLSGRKALQDLKEHRERLATELRSLKLELSSTVGHLEREIAIIDEGLAKLNNTASVVSIAIRWLARGLSLLCARCRFFNGLWTSLLEAASGLAANTRATHRRRHVGGLFFGPSEPPACDLAVVSQFENQWILPSFLIIARWILAYSCATFQPSSLCEDLVVLRTLLNALSVVLTFLTMASPCEAYC